LDFSYPVEMGKKIKSRNEKIELSNRYKKEKTITRAVSDLSIVLLGWAEYSQLLEILCKRENRN